MNSLSVTCKNVGKTRFCGSTRGHELYCDVTPEYGGGDVDMLPAESLLATLGNCLGLAVALTCMMKEIPYEGMEVAVTGEYVDGGSRVDKIRCEVKMPQELDERQRAIVEGAKALCRVGSTLTHGATIEEVVL